MKNRGQIGCATAIEFVWIIETCSCPDLNWGSHENLQTERKQILVAERIILGIGFHFKSIYIFLAKSQNSWILELSSDILWCVNYIFRR